MSGVEFAILLASIYLAPTMPKPVAIIFAMVVVIIQAVLLDGQTAN